ncbi:MULTISPECIES: TetR/AcrR family transcriptional regulator [unclassified Streptomyces]|uniref:TetR/AcrR family transcriptional regulator n=1 Tax=unclassified Streptomyces TaxID=2593676 RepID=UPI000B83F335|nr:TetR/AcrR family transcriptional regulator [Streptomyces sp. DvalAA-14]MYS21645.1 TetR family transcriptional regulator [Streptomyces sp. SID4948]
MSPRHIDPKLGENLIEAAAKLLAEEGPQALSTRRLAAAVGTSTMAVYTRFGGKEDLVRAMVREGFQLLDQEMTAVHETADPVCDVVALGWAYRRNALEHRNLYGVMFGGPGLGGFALTDEDRQHGRYTLSSVVRAVERCMEAKRFHAGDAQLVAHQLWIALHGLVTLELGGYLIPPYDADTCYEAQISALLVGAGEDPAEAAAVMKRARDRRD